METVILSGFGGGYEEMCQKMLWRGVAHLAEMKPDISMWDQAKENPHIYGIFITDGEGLKALDDAIIKPGDDAIGAMHHCVMGHLRFIHRNGTAQWLEELKTQKTPDKFFEWNGEL